MRKLMVLSYLLIACDGSGVDGTVEPTTAPDATTTPSDVEPDTTPTLPEPTVLDGELDLPVVVPPPPVVVVDDPLPGGTTDGTGVIVAREALEGHFLYGMGASPDGIVASLGGGAGGLNPIRAGVRLVSGEGGGILEVRAYDGDALDTGSDGLIEAYPYTDVDADTVRVDFAAPQTPIEIAVYGQCRYVLSEGTLHGAPVYADGLMTWAVDEQYERQGNNCNWLQRNVEGLHVHYLRHESASRGFKARAEDPEGEFGFFLAGESEPTLARLPGLAADEPAKTYTYYLSDSFPEDMVPAAIETFEAWNDALEEVVGRRPFVVERAPEGMIAWDPRYHVVLWDASGGSGAIAPFTNDPDSGEIFQSFVVMYFGDVESIVDRYTSFFEEHPDVEAALAPVPAPSQMQDRAPFELPELPIGHMTRPSDVPPNVLTTRPFVRRPFDDDQVRQTMVHMKELGIDLSDTEVEHIIVVDFLLHELGHNLGLRHNFIGSVDHKRHADDHSSSTTMDYVIGMLDPGSYDRDAMRYAYGSEKVAKREYLYCTDETIELEPACVQWDYGHPIRAQLGRIDQYFVTNGPDSSKSEIDNLLEEGTFDKELTRLRAMVNTTYENWDETPVMTFEELLDRVDCGAECPQHLRLRNALALYLLYSKHVVTAYWEPNYPDVWLDFPQLSETQAALLMDRYFGIVTDRAEPLSLKTTIVGKLPTSAVVGAADLLTRLDTYFAGLETLTSDEQAVKSAVTSALADL